MPVIAGVVQRIGIRQRPGGRKLRQQIAELYGPSVALVFSRKKIQAKLSAFIREIVPQEIERAFRFITG